MDHLSPIDGEEPKGVDEDLLDAYIFNIKMVFKWREEYIPLMIIGELHITLGASPLTIIFGCMHHLRIN